MATWVRDIEVTQNEDLALVFGFASQDPSGNLSRGVPWNFSGFTAKMQVRVLADPTSTELLALTTSSGLVLAGPTTIAGVSCGTLTMTFAHAQTADMPAGTWFYDVFTYSLAGLQSPLMQGTLVMKPSGTR